MPVQVLEMKSAVSAATVLKRIRAFKVPAWSMAVLVVLAGVYGYVSGRQNPVHHYVPYVGYPLVLDTTTGKACYSSPPKPSDDAIATTGPAIPMCEN
jgi:hypothetical protein